MTGARRLPRRVSMDLPVFGTTNYTKSRKLQPT